MGGGLLTLTLLGKKGLVATPIIDHLKSDFNPQTTSLTEAFETWRSKPLILNISGARGPPPPARRPCGPPPGGPQQHPVASLSGITPEQFGSEKRTLQNVFEGSLLKTYNECETLLEEEEEESTSSACSSASGSSSAPGLIVSDGDCQPRWW